MLNLFWFRRDLRLTDNAGLFHCLKNFKNVQPIFIFDTNILNALKNPKDTRVSFIHYQVAELKAQLQKQGSDLWVFVGNPLDVFKWLFKNHSLHSVTTNSDYEPSALERDYEVANLVRDYNGEFQSFKDQVIFEKSEILTDAKKPYTVFTPYKNKWLGSLNASHFNSYETGKYFSNLNKAKSKKALITLKELGFEEIAKDFFPPPILNKNLLKKYQAERDFPALDATTHLGLHLRFGTVSIREMAREGQKLSATWLSELIWREFFMQILFHYPHVVKGSFKEVYDNIKWRNSPGDFKKWCEGKTGYPLVDAGMRELNSTGFMHNRVRMVTASFLCKHLLIYWLEGERYFASKLLDYDLSANNGNWQWAAGTGCDAAPYFRVFNPTTQMEKFDPDYKYVKKWVPEFGTAKQLPPMIDHVEARDRCLREYKKALSSSS